MANRRVGGWLLVLSGLLATTIAVWWYPRAFPLSGLHLRVSRGEAQRLAAQFLQQMGIQPPRGYRAVTTFEADGTVTAYLERTLGLREANRLAQREGFAYAWSTRWFRPDQETEYYVDVDPEGRLVFFAQYLPDQQALPESRQPRQVAERFLQDRAGIALHQYRLVSEERQPQASRVEYRFTWERQGFRLGEATQRVAVSVSGDRVLTFVRWLKIPERFKEATDREQERGEQIADISFRFGTLLHILQLVIVVVALVRREIDWRVIWVPALLLLSVSLLGALNSIPLWIAQMETGQTWAAFWVQVLLGVPMDAIYTTLRLLAVVVAAEYLYRKWCPDDIPLRHWLTRGGIASGAGRARVALGYWVLAMDLLYTVLFYAVGRQVFGVWMHSSVPYDDMMSTYLPWVYSLLDAIEPAFTEELADRLLLIVALTALLRRRWLGIVLSALLWSLAHCGYPSQPYYIRAVELFPVGVFWGWLVMRYGPLPTLIAHFGYNALTGSDIFLYSDQWGVRLSFAVVVGFVLAPALLTFWWGRRAGAAAALPAPATNRELDALLQAERAPLPAASPPPVSEPPFPTLPRRTLWGAVLCTAGLVAVATAVQDVERAQSRFPWAQGEENPLRTRYLGSQQALDAARQHLPGRGQEVQGWRSETFLDDDGKGGAYRYLRRHLSKADADALWARLVYPPVNWEVHWWKPGTSERWLVVLTPDGGLWERYCWLPEDAPGEKVSATRARQLAEEAVARLLGFPLDRLQLEGIESENLPNRGYHRFQWQLRGLEVGKARVVVVAEVNGAVVTDLYRDVLYPEDEEERVTTSLQAFGEFASRIVLFLLALRVILVIVQVVRRYPVPWGWGMRLAVVGALLVVALLLIAPSREMTSTDGALSSLWEAFDQWGRIVLLGMAAALFFLTLSVAVPAWQLAFPSLPSPLQWSEALRHPARHRRLWREAVVAQAGGWALLVALSVTSDLAHLWNKPLSTARIPEWVVQIPAYIGSPSWSVNASSPLMCCLLLALLAGIVAMFGWMALAAWVKVALGSVRHAAVWYGVLVLLVALTSRGTAQLVDYLATATVAFVGGWLLHRFVVQYNPLVVFVTAVNVVLLSQGGALLPFAPYRATGALLLALAGIMLLWAVWDWAWERRRGRRAGIAPAHSESVP